MYNRYTKPEKNLRLCLLWSKSDFSIKINNSHFFLFQTRLITFLLVVGTAAALDLKALCPAYPFCDNALIAAYMKLENPQPAAPCPNFPLCDVNHVALAQRAAGRRKRSLPVPGTIPGLLPGSAAEAQWYQQQLTALAARASAPAGPLPVPGTTGLAPGSAAEAQWYQQQLTALAALGRKKRAIPVPGTVPGLVSGSAAEAQWYAALLIHQQQIAQQVRRKRSLPVPGTTGLVPGSAAEAQWYQQQLAALAPRANVAPASPLPVPGTTGLVPGSAAEAQWYQQQLTALAALGRK